MSDEPVLLSLGETSATVTVNRPSTLNSLDEVVLNALGAVLDQVAKSAARAVIVTGAGGRAFVAGADIAAM
jgi:enoyl-CoA hydratase